MKGKKKNVLQMEERTDQLNELNPQARMSLLSFKYNKTIIEFGFRMI
jgi:hypothetical protein